MVKQTGKTFNFKRNHLMLKRQPNSKKSVPFNHIFPANLISSSEKKTRVKWSYTNYSQFLGGKLSFPEFLKVMHDHSRVENLPTEVVEAFRAGDTSKKGVISARHLKHLLLRWGEHLSPKEGKSSMATFLSLKNSW